MRNRSLALVVVVLILGVPAFAADSSRDRRDDRGPLQRIVRIVKQVFGITSNADGLTPPLPGGASGPKP